LEFPFVLYFTKYSKNRNQSDLRRFELKSCKLLVVEQTSATFASALGVV
jgi:hypothetical protein